MLTDPSVLLRVDGPLYFADAERLEDQVLDTADRRSGLGAVVLDAAAISAHALGRLHEQLADRGVALHLATVRGLVRDLLDRTGIWAPVVASGSVHATSQRRWPRCGWLAPARCAAPVRTPPASRSRCLDGPVLAGLDGRIWRCAPF